MNQAAGQAGAAQAERIPVLQTDRRVELPRPEGRVGVVVVRRLKRTDVTDLTGVANPRDGDAHSQMLLAELLRRAQIVDAEDLTDADTGEAVPFAAVRVGGFRRPVASRDVFNALSDADLSLIDAACPLMPGGLTDAQRGNS